MIKSKLILVLAAVAMGATANAAGGSSDSLQIADSNKSSVLFTSEQAESAVSELAGASSTVSGTIADEVGIVGLASLRSSDTLILDLGQASGSQSAAGKDAKANEGPAVRTSFAVSEGSARAVESVATSQLVVLAMNASGALYGVSEKGLKAIDGLSVQSYNGVVVPSVNNGLVPASNSTYTFLVTDVSGNVARASVDTVEWIDTEILSPVSAGVVASGTAIGGGISHVAGEINDEVVRPVGKGLSDSTMWLADESGKAAGFASDSVGAIATGSAASIAVTVGKSEASYVVQKAEENGSFVTAISASGNLIIALIEAPSEASTALLSEDGATAEDFRKRRAKRKVIAIKALKADKVGETSSLMKGSLQN